MTTQTITDPLAIEAADTIASADFRVLWPIEVRQTLVRAARTEGDMPAFGVKATRWALNQARRIERANDAAVERAEAIKGRRFR